MAKIKVLRVVAKSGSFVAPVINSLLTPQIFRWMGLKRSARRDQGESALVSYEVEVDEVISTETDDTQNNAKKPASSGKK
jgi:hypothetical protein